MTTQCLNDQWSNADHNNAIVSMYNIKLPLDFYFIIFLHIIILSK